MHCHGLAFSVSGTHQTSNQQGSTVHCNSGLHDTVNNRSAREHCQDPQAFLKTCKLLCWPELVLTALCPNHAATAKSGVKPTLLYGSCMKFWYSVPAWAEVSRARRAAFLCLSRSMILSLAVVRMYWWLPCMEPAAQCVCVGNQACWLLVGGMH